MDTDEWEGVGVVGAQARALFSGNLHTIFVFVSDLGLLLNCKLAHECVISWRCFSDYSYIETFYKQLFFLLNVSIHFFNQ